MSVSIPTESDTTTKAQAVFCCLCGLHGEPTDQWVNERVCQRVERSAMKWFPTLNRYAHEACLGRAVQQLETLIEDFGPVVRLFMARLYNGAETQTCTICDRLDEVMFSTSLGKHLAHDDQVTPLFQHPILGPVHSHCVAKLVSWSHHLGVDISPILVKLKMKSIGWRDYYSQTSNLSHWHTATQRWNGEHIGRRYKVGDYTD